MAALLVLATATPAAAATDGVDLAVTVAFDRTDYLAYEDITVLLTIANNGTAPATGVTMTYETNASLGPDAWPALWESLAPDTSGTTIAPGERIELPARFELNSVVDELRVSFEVRAAEQDTDTTNNTATAAATITVHTGDLVGTLYGDRDGDKEFDPDEAMNGVQVTSRGGVPYTDISTRTDAGGRFTVPGVPEGRYTLDLRLPAGWQSDETAVVEVRSDGGESFVRAVRDSSALRSSITFDKPTYVVGETIRETVTLTNTGATDLSGVTARCVEGAAPNQLSGLGWGDLVHEEAPGVTVRAGETRTFTFTDVVPPGGYLYGFITITCWFSTAFRYDDGPVAMARSEVPGGRGSSGGVLFVDRNDDFSVAPDEAVPNVKVFLVHEDGRVIAHAVTDAAGHFMFADRPANSYYLRLAGPWRLEQEGARIGVFADEVIDQMPYPVEPGPSQPDLDVHTPSTVDVVPAPVPAPQAAPVRPRPTSLADTGADVIELTMFGVLLLFAGGVLLLVRRSRENM